jgi:hypothetical protein
MEAVAIVAIIAGVGGAFVSVLHTIKTSQCGCCSINTRTPPQTPNIPPQTPIQTPKSTQIIKRKEPTNQLEFIQSNDV